MTRETCGYGDRARSDCRKVFKCQGDAWMDISSACLRPPDGYCPAERPAAEDPCEVTLFAFTGTVPQCEYGPDVTCNCGGTRFGDRGPFWSCNERPTDPDCPDVAPNWGEGCTAQGIECTYGPACQPGTGHWVCRSGQWEYAGFVGVCHDE